MRKFLRRALELAMPGAFLTVVAAMIVAAMPGPARRPPKDHLCGRPDCPRVDHSPTAWAAAEARDRTLARIGAIDLDTIRD